MITEPSQTCTDYQTKFGAYKKSSKGKSKDSCYLNNVIEGYDHNLVWNGQTAKKEHFFGEGVGSLEFIPRGNLGAIKGTGEILQWGTGPIKYHPSSHEWTL